MKISSSFNTLDRRKNYQSFKGVPPNPKYLPELLGKAGKLVGEYISMPEQKLFMATTALLLQPLIDLKFAKEDKKIDAAIKSASKSIAGGLTGVAIRAGFIALTTSQIQFQKTSKFRHHFMPKKAVEMYRKEPEYAKLLLKQYNQSLGTLMAIAVMVLITNPKIDVPLTSDLQDLISGVVKENKTWLQSFREVKDRRAKILKGKIDKVKNFFNKSGEKLDKIVNIIKQDEKKKEEVKK